MSSPENGSNSAYAQPGQAIETIVNRSVDKPTIPAEDFREIARIVQQEKVGPVEVFEDTDQISHEQDRQEHVEHQTYMGD